MRFLFVSLVLSMAGSAALVLTPLQAGDMSIPEQLEAASVTILAGRHQGSGALHQTKDGRTWVLTAGHVIQSLKQTRTILDDAGHAKQIVEFPDVQALSLMKDGGRNVGEYHYNLEVIRYSSPDYGDDLALLRVRSRSFKPPVSIKFYQGQDIPRIGTDLWHCGSLLGEFGNNSITAGNVSSVGRLLYERVYDQTSCTAFPGSSGGPIVLKSSGEYVGMIVRGAGEGFNLIVPIRRINAWADRVGARFVLDESKPVPTEEELRKKPVEEKATFGVRNNYAAGQGSN